MWQALDVVDFPDDRALADDDRHRGDKLYLVKDLLPEQSKMGEAAELIQTAYPATDKPAWGTLISEIFNTPEKHDPELVAGLKSLLEEDKWAEKMNLLSFEGTVNPVKILSAVLMISVAEGRVRPPRK